MNEDIRDKFRALGFDVPDEPEQEEKPKKEEKSNSKKESNSSSLIHSNKGKKSHSHPGKGSNNFSKGGKPFHHSTAKSAKNSNEASASYNFIPFTRTVLASPLDAMKDDFRGYIESQETYSGTLALEITTVTPLFVGGDDAEAFFSPTGEPLIPGSTLRGMVRNLFKIITAGSMRRDEDFTDRHLYFRCIMAPDSMPQLKALNEYYEKRMVSGEKNPDTDRPKKNARPAFLYRLEKDGTYYLAPCEMSFVDMKTYGTVPEKSGVNWNIRKKIVYILTGKQPKNKTEPKDGNKQEKKNIRYLYSPDWEKAMPVPDRIIQEYRDDTRRRGVNLLEDKGSSKQQVPLRGRAARDFADRNDIDFIVPCFYTNNEDGEITSFGHGRSYRIPYQKSVGDRLPAVLQKNPDIVDFADAVFGRKEDWAGRVSFEDAHLTSPAKLGSKDWVKPLLGANPTSYQLYLTQNDWPPAHWDSDAPIELRGYKMYWHKKLGNNGWQAEGQEASPKITKQIEPLLEGNKFSSAIHFRNLTAVELGALLKVFRLRESNEAIVYKLGMGKSLGMGSVRIKMELYLDSERYGALFDNGKWQKSSKSANVRDFIEAFDSYVKEHIGSAEESYQASLKNLRIMLDWNNTGRPGWADEDSNVIDVRDFKNDQFKKKKILPTLEQIVK